MAAAQMKERGAAVLVGGVAVVVLGLFTARGVLSRRHVERVALGDPMSRVFGRLGDARRKDHRKQESNDSHCHTGSKARSFGQTGSIDAGSVNAGHASCLVDESSIESAARRDDLASLATDVLASSKASAAGRVSKPHHRLR